MLHRLKRLDVSIDMAVHLVLIQIFAQGVIPLLVESQILGCGTALTEYAVDTADGLRGWLGYSLLFVVLLFMWLETRVTLRPWFKRLLRLSGPLVLASLMVPFQLYLLFVVPHTR